MRKKTIIIISVIFPFSEKFVSVYKTIADSCEKYFFFWKWKHGIFGD